MDVKVNFLYFIVEKYHLWTCRPKSLLLLKLHCVNLPASRTEMRLGEEGGGRVLVLGGAFDYTRLTPSMQIHIVNSEMLQILGLV